MQSFPADFTFEHLRQSDPEKLCQLRQEVYNKIKQAHVDGKEYCEFTLPHGKEQKQVIQELAPRFPNLQFHKTIVYGDYDEWIPFDPEHPHYSDHYRVSLV
jgi:hypothetical protein